MITPKKGEQGIAVKNKTMTDYKNENIASK